MNDHRSHRQAKSVMDNCKLLLICAGMALLGSGPAQAMPGMPTMPKDYPFPQCWNTTQAYDIDFVGPLRNETIGAVTFGYHRFGPLAGPPAKSAPVVLLPGLAAMMYLWPIPLLQRLAVDREVLMFDYPGTGASKNSNSSSNSSSSSTLSVAGLGSGVMGLIRRMNFTQAPDVAGWSLGGMVALTLAASYSSELGSLVIISGSAGGPASYAPPFADWDAYLRVPVGGILEESKFLFPQGLKDPGVCSLYASWNSFYASKYTSAKRLTVRGEQAILQQAAAMQNFYLDSRTYDALPNITNRVLLVHGVQDRLVPTRNAAVAAAQIAASWMIQAPGAGHGVLFQNVKRSISVILEFLGQVDGRLKPEALDWYDYGEQLPPGTPPVTLDQLMSYLDIQRPKGTPSSPLPGSSSNATTTTNGTTIGSSSVNGSNTTTTTTSSSNNATTTTNGATTGTSSVSASNTTTTATSSSGSSSSVTVVNGTTVLVSGPLPLPNGNNTVTINGVPVVVNASLVLASSSRVVITITGSMALANDSNNGLVISNSSVAITNGSVSLVNGSLVVKGSSASMVTGEMGTPIRVTPGVQKGAFELGGTSTIMGGNATSPTAGSVFNGSTRRAGSNATTASATTNSSSSSSGNTASSSGANTTGTSLSGSSSTGGNSSTTAGAVAGASSVTIDVVTTWPSGATAVPKGSTAFSKSINGTVRLVLVPELSSIDSSSGGARGGSVPAAPHPGGQHGSALAAPSSVSIPIMLRAQQQHSGHTSPKILTTGWSQGPEEYVTSDTRSDARSATATVQVPQVASASGSGGGPPHPVQMQATAIKGQDLDGAAHGAAAKAIISNTYLGQGA